MANKSVTRSKRGRPATGKKAFCVRLTPKAQSELCKAAAKHGLQLSEWLEAVAAVKGDFFTDEEGGYDPEEAARRLRFVVPEAYSLIAEIHNMIDLGPSLAKDPCVNLPLRNIQKESTGLFYLLEHEGYLTGIRNS